jgi:hypothetical protein
MPPLLVVQNPPNVKPRPELRSLLVLDEAAVLDGDYLGQDPAPEFLHAAVLLCLQFEDSSGRYFIDG